MTKQLLALILSCFILFYCDLVLGHAAGYSQAHMSHNKRCVFHNNYSRLLHQKVSYSALTQKLNVQYQVRPNYSAAHQLSTLSTRVVCRGAFTFKDAVQLSSHSFSALVKPCERNIAHAGANTGDRNESREEDWSP